MDREYLTYMLLNAPGFGSRSVYYIYNNLKKHGLSISSLFELSKHDLADIFPELGHGKFSKAKLLSLSSLNDSQIQITYKKLKEQKVSIIGLDDELYPKAINEKLGENAPPVLFCKGNMQLLNTKSVSIVGSRDVNDFALLLTKRIAGRLAKIGFNVTSGFAKGVDTNAHLGALQEDGTTTMVLSYGFNYLNIKKEIKSVNKDENTLFVSQFMPYEKFSGQNAMIRNKLVCALSDAVIVISSGPEKDNKGKMSGTYDAGLTALKYNIPLFVLAPELLKPTPPKGNSDLINMGGMLLSNGSQLVEYFNNPIHEKIIEAPEVSKEGIYKYADLQESEMVYNLDNNNIKVEILKLLSQKPLTASELVKKLQFKLTTQKLISILKDIPDVEVFKKGRSNFYSFNKKQPTLFA